FSFAIAIGDLQVLSRPKAVCPDINKQTGSSVLSRDKSEPAMLSISRKSTELPADLAAANDQIRATAKSYGLDFFDVIFEMLDFDQINHIASYGGFPVRYPHWRFGMEYERTSKQHNYGLGRIYEMVINTDPCYAYLQRSNSIMDQKLVMAHVYAHCDFFKNNLWFSKT